MKILLLSLCLLLGGSIIAQSIDSTWVLTQYLPRFYTDTGTYLPVTKFVDTNQNETDLTDYKGKILYIDIWATWCKNCLEKFPYEEQLLKRLKANHLDSQLQFININIDDTRQEWQNSLKKYHPIGTNLYCSDTSLPTKWNIQALPAYILLDSSGKVLGKDICKPDEPLTIDYVLYAATKGVHPVQAVLKHFEQSKIMEKSRSSNAFTDEDYSKWYQKNNQAFNEYIEWRDKHEHNNL